MTLAVAVKFPWPGFYDSLPAQVRAVMDAFPERRPSPAVLMSADSRWSWPNGTTDDGGVKIARVDSHAAATYCGNTEAGERVLGLLAEAFRAVRGYGGQGTAAPTAVLEREGRTHGAVAGD